MTTNKYDVVFIGAGIVGTSTAMQFQQKNPHLKTIVIETENKPAAHQTGNNSGVIHSGLYYKPGSLKALNCISGREKMYDFCQKHNIPHERCGKIVVALNQTEIERLESLYQRGLENGLEGLKKLTADELKEYEPHAAGIAGLFVPQTGIVDYRVVTEKYVELYKESGGTVNLSEPVLKVNRSADKIIVTTSKSEYETKLVVNCAGLHSDRVAKMCGHKPGVIIAPFRGEYKKLAKEKEYLVKNLIYPVPDPAFPFLGVHFTRMMRGGVEAGPNAVPAFKRNGYSWGEISLKDMTEMFFFPGFLKMASKYAKMGLGEIFRSLNSTAFHAALQRLLPELKKEDLVKGGAGVRAQALTPEGKLLDDFCIEEEDNFVHVLNAPSPAATASLSIGETISDLISKRIKK